MQIAFKKRQVPEKTTTNPICSAFNCWNLAVVWCDCWPDMNIYRAQQSPSALDLTTGTQSTNPLHPHSFLLLKSPLLFLKKSFKNFLSFPSQCFPSVLGNSRCPEETQNDQSGNVTLKTLYFSLLAMMAYVFNPST